MWWWALDHDSRRVFGVSNECAGLDAAERWKFPIEHDEIRSNLEHPFERLLAVGSARDFKPFQPVLAALGSLVSVAAAHAGPARPVDCWRSPHRDTGSSRGRVGRDRRLVVSGGASGVVVDRRRARRDSTPPHIDAARVSARPALSLSRQIGTDTLGALKTSEASWRSPEWPIWR